MMNAIEVSLSEIKPRQWRRHRRKQVVFAGLSKSRATFTFISILLLADHIVRNVASSDQTQFSSPELKYTLKNGRFSDQRSIEGGEKNQEGSGLTDWNPLDNDNNDDGNVPDVCGVHSWAWSKRSILPKPFSVGSALASTENTDGNEEDHDEKNPRNIDPLSSNLLSSVQNRFKLPTPKGVTGRYITDGGIPSMNPVDLKLPGRTSSHHRQDFAGSHPSKQRRQLKLRKTGTTIAGCVVCDPDTGEEYVVLAADTRATSGSTVADKRCEKVHFLADNIWCCGAGTSADNDALVRQIKYGIKVEQCFRQSIGNASRKQVPPAPVRAVIRRIRNQLFDAQGELGVNLVLGGYDFHSDRATLVAIHPHGSVDEVPFAALGSGGLAAMSVLEMGYRLDISLEEGIQLVKKAISAGITNDLGSGSQVDLVIMSRHGSNYTRAVIPEEELPEEYRHVTTTHDCSVFSDDIDKFNNSNSSSTTTMINGNATNLFENTGGVNGFGNVPFAIRSVQTVVPSEKAVQDVCDKFWDEIESAAFSSKM